MELGTVKAMEIFLCTEVVMQIRQILCRNDLLIQIMRLQEQTKKDCMVELEL
jgi:hypothetical protein